MSVARTARAKRGKSSRPAKSSRRTPAAAPFVPGRHDARDAMRLIARGRVEADLITSALADAPPLDREAMGAERYPFNEIASAESVQAVVEKIVRRRIPDNQWNDVHTPLCKTDQSGNGYWSWVDTFRDVAFLVGVDYTLRSLPSWWANFQALPDDKRKACTILMQRMIDGVAADTNGGAR